MQVSKRLGNKFNLSNKKVFFHVVRATTRRASIMCDRLLEDISVGQERNQRGWRRMPGSPIGSLPLSVLTSILLLPDHMAEVLLSLIKLGCSGLPSASSKVINSCFITSDDVTEEWGHDIGGCRCVSDARGWLVEVLTGSVTVLGVTCYQ